MPKILKYNNKVVTANNKVASNTQGITPEEFTITLNKINADYTTITFAEYESVTGDTWTFAPDTTPVASITNDSSVTGITLQFTEPNQQDGNTTLITNDTQLQFDSGSHNNTYDVRLTVENRYLIEVDYVDTQSQGYSINDLTTGTTLEVRVFTGFGQSHLVEPLGNISLNEWIVSSGTSFSNNIQTKLYTAPDIDPYTTDYSPTDIQAYNLVESIGTNGVSMGDHNEPEAFSISQSGDTYVKVDTDYMLYKLILDNDWASEYPFYTFYTSGPQGASGITETYKHYKYIWKDFNNNVGSYTINTSDQIESISPSTYVTYTAFNPNFSMDVYNVNMGNEYEILITFFAA